MKVNKSVCHVSAIKCIHWNTAVNIVVDKLSNLIQFSRLKKLKTGSLTAIALKTNQNSTQYKSLHNVF